MEKKQKVLIGIGTVAVLATLAFVYQYIMYVSTDNAQVEAHTVMLAPKVTGFVKTVNIVEGQRVKAGDLLIELDSRDYENSLKQAKGELASVQARLRDAERNFKRLQDLFGKDAISQQQFDQASANFNDIKARFEAVNAQVSQGELNLANTHMMAPSDGFIARKSVNIGQLAAVGIPLAGFVDGGERWVSANFKETEVEDVAVGAAVDVTVDAISHRTFKGKVQALSAATGATFTLLPPDNATGNFTKVVQRVPVRILLEGLTPEDTEKLRAGLSANVKVHKH
jgi:membrane fusion protein (multidrug efflux system)